MKIARILAVASFALGIILAIPALSGSARVEAKGKGKADKADKSAPVPAAAKEEAQKYYATICITCHGPKGDGDGVGAAALPTKPRKFSDPAWQKSVKNAEIEKAILEGGASIGKSPLMPPNPALKDKPEVIAGLREMVRAFGGGK